MQTCRLLGLMAPKSPNEKQSRVSSRDVVSCFGISMEELLYDSLRQRMQSLVFRGEE